MAKQLSTGRLWDTIAMQMCRTLASAPPTTSLQVRKTISEGEGGGEGGGKHAKEKELRAGENEIETEKRLENITIRGRREKKRKGHY